MTELFFNDFRNEFWFHVSNQNEIPVFGSIEKSIDTELLYTIVQGMAEDKPVDYLKEVIKSNSGVIDTLRTIVGITDKRMYLELSYIFNKIKIDENGDKNILGESVYSLKKHSVSYFERIISGNSEKSDIALGVVTTYLLERGLLATLKFLKKLTFDEMCDFVDHVLLPKEIQQEETKRRGHGAEQALALLLKQMNVSFVPENKAENPMSADDPNVDKVSFEFAQRDENLTWSMDLIIGKDDAIKVMVQGLIHTSDPGQYGVNKSGETVLVRQGLDQYNASHDEKKELWGLVDGVGFVENPEHTVFKMLGCFDTFVQLKSLYKAALKLHKLGMVKIKAIRFDMDFYAEKEAREMFVKYGSDDILVVLDGTIPDGREIKAGKAWLYL